MENEVEVACFGGQVKTCGDSRIVSPQWKSGWVRVYRREDGTMNAKMFLNVSPLKPTSQISVLPADLNVKSNRVIVTDAKGMGFYVRLGGPKEIENSRNIINRLSSYECSKRSKAEVGSFNMTPAKMNGKHVESKSKGTTESYGMKFSPSAYTPHRTNKLHGSLSPQLKGLSPTDNGGGISQKRRSSEVDEGYHDNEYYGGPVGKKSTFTSVKDAGFKSPRVSKNTESGSFKSLNSGSFYGKNTPKSYGIKEPARQNLPGTDRLYRAGLVPQSEGKRSDASPTPHPSPESASVAAAERAEAEVPFAEHDYTGDDSLQARSMADDSPLGFTNLGNTCFINSPLQCLSSLEPLSLDIQDIVWQHGRNLKQESVIRLLYFLMKYVRSHTLRGVKITILLKVLRETLFGKFANNTQQDAHELLSEILDRVHEEIQELKRLEEKEEEDGLDEDIADTKDKTETLKERLELPTTSHGADSRKKSREKLSRYILSPTEKNFTWFFKNSFHFHECKRQIWSQEEHDTTLMLAFNSKPHLHLQDCVDDYFKSCDVEFKCESCDKNEAATITRKIIRRPRCLILNLLRYQTDSVESKKKLDSISIPRYISIADFCVEDVKDPLYINPVFMSEKESPDESEEIMLHFLLKAQEEMDAEAKEQKERENNACGVSKHEAKNDDSVTSTNAENEQMEISLPENSSDPSMNPCADRGEKPTEGEKIENSDSDLATQVSSQDESDEKREEEDKVSSLNVDLMKRRKLEERLKCRGGSLEGMTPIHIKVEDDEAFSELTSEEDSSRSNGKVFPSPRFSASTQTEERSGHMSKTEEDYGNISVGYEASSEGDSSRSNKVDVITYSPDGGRGNKNSNSTHSSATELARGLLRGAMSDGEGGIAALPPVPNESLSENEDLDNQMLCGRKVCRYSERDLQGLNVDALTDNEMLIYAQALSRFEYIKEKGAELAAYQVASSVLEDASEDFSNLDCEVGLNGDTSYRDCESSSERVHDFDNLNVRGDATMSSISVESSSSRTRGKRNADSGAETGKESETASADNDPFAEAANVFSEFESSVMSPRAASKVPDIFETSFDAGLREEASFHEDRVSTAEDRDGDKHQSRVLQNWHPSRAKLSGSSADGSRQLEEPDSTSSQRQQAGSHLRLERCIFCDGPISDGQCFKCDSATRDFGCVPMDECFGMDDSSISEDVFTKEQSSSKSGILSETGNKNVGFTSASNVVKSPYFLDSNLRNIWSNNKKVPNVNKKADEDAAPPMSSPSPSSSSSSSSSLLSSAFQKPKQDMYIVSPSKTKNLVKTRDYSRLRSPIKSPRKKPSKVSPQKKTPAANKQLIFQDSEKDSWEKSLDKSLSSLPVLSDLECNVSIEDGECESTSESVVVEDGITSEHISNRGDKPNLSSSSCKARPDVGGLSSSIVAEKSCSSSSSSSSTTLQVINTSTPISTAIQESCSSKGGAQQPLHISVSPAADCPVKTSATLSNPQVQAPSSVQNASAVGEGTHRSSKASRSLSVSFAAAAEEKENSGDSKEDEQARRKRLIHIESGESDCSYRLVGVVNHHGASLFAGHYTSFSFNWHKQRWFYLNDTLTKDATEPNVRHDSTCNGYVFFYMDKNLFDSYSGMKERPTKGSMT